MTGDGGNISSSLYCNFLREDLNFVLGEVKNGFLKKVSNLKIFHILMNILNIVLSFYMIILYYLISYDLSNFMIDNENVKKIKEPDESSIKKIIKEQKIVKSLFSREKTIINDQINLKNGNHRPIIITINGNTVNNFFNREVEIGDKNKNSNIISQINNSNSIKLNDIFLKNEAAKKNSLIQIDGEDADFPSKTNIIGELQNIHDILKLNKNKK